MKKSTRKNSTKRSSSSARAASPSKPMATETKKDSCCGVGCSCCWGSWSLLFARLVLAGLFLAKGISKVMDPAATNAAFVSMGFWGWLGPVVGAAEVVAGALLLLGLWSRWAGKVVAVIMTVAIFTVHFKQGWANFPYVPFFALATALVIVGNGPGAWAADTKCGCANSCRCC